MLRFGKRGVGLAGALTLLWGCSGLGGPLVSPQEGGPQWHEISSTHFVMNTDVSTSDAVEQLIEYERLYQALSFVWGVKDGGERVRLVLFDRDLDYHAFVPDKLVSGHFSAQLPGDVDGMPYLAFARGDRHDVRRTFLHEVGHRLNHQRFFALPTWLDEGLAEFASTMTVDDTEIHIGGPLDAGDFWDDDNFKTDVDAYRERHVRVPLRLAPTVKEIVTSDHETFLGGDPFVHYVAAWKLVQMLKEGTDADRHAFDAMLGDLQNGISPARAFDDHFGSRLPDLERRYHAYLIEDELVREVFRAPRTRASPPRGRVMTEGEVHLLWGKLMPRDFNPALAEEQFAKALASEPRSAEVRFARAVKYLRSQRLADARREIGLALEIAPDEPRFLLVRLACAGIVEARVDNDQGASVAFSQEDSEIVARLARVARTAPELASVAAARAKNHQPDDALTFAERAIAVDPLCSSCFRVRALLLEASGRLDDAFRDMNRAISLLPEGAPVEALLRERKRIAKARKP